MNAFLAPFGPEPSRLHPPDRPRQGASASPFLLAHVILVSLKDLHATHRFAYEDPEHPEVRIDTVIEEPEQAAVTVIAHLRATGVLHPPQGGCLSARARGRFMREPVGCFRLRHNECPPLGFLPSVD